MSIKQDQGFFGSFFDELLLYSGQYALFYILMNFSKEKLGYFSDFGHTILLFILILQTILLARYGGKPLFRFLGSLIAPLIYTLLEYKTGEGFFTNTAHVFFWIFSIITGAFQAFSLRTENIRSKQVIEFIITTVNVSIFIFIYFVFDLSLTVAERVATGQMTAAMAAANLTTGNLLPAFGIFIGDPAHVFLLLGGMLLSLSLSIGRVKIVTLKETINDLFGKYVDKSIRDRIVSDGSGRSERKTLCILFADIKNFTTVTEKADAEAVTGMLNTAFTQWDTIVRKNNGVIDKFIGDAIMVMFGLEKPETSSADAVACARDMIAGLSTLRTDLAKKRLPVLENIRIGISRGEVILGDIGSPDRRNFTTVGDTVNIASRLESLCKEHDMHLIVSEDVHRHISSVEAGRFSPLGDVSLKGKLQKVAVYGLRL